MPIKKKSDKTQTKNTKIDLNKKPEHIKFKLVMYFLIGFLLPFIGTIIAGIWLKFKTKTYRKKKLIALLLGAGINLLYAFILGPIITRTFIQPSLEEKFFQAYPEAQIVTQTIQKEYPNAQIAVRINTNTISSGGKEATTTTFSVQHLSTQTFLTAKQMQGIAKQTCSILAERNITYDRVGVLSLKYILPLHLAELHMTIQNSCKEWQTEDISKEKLPF